MLARSTSLAGLLGASLLADPLELHLRDRLESPPGSGLYEIRERTVAWDPARTALILCDMWDQHWCRSATERVAEMAPRLDEVVNAARARGVLIIHAPSSTLAFYAETPQRRLAQAAPPVEPRVPLRGWCGLDPDREGRLPIDDSDGGCDDWPPCPQASPWTRQIPTLSIHPGDAITDSAEAYYLIRQRGIRHVILAGVHLNMCVLGRPFGIRQLVAQDLEVALLRDLTDTMYNSRRPPHVSHFAGTDLMVAHVEKFWCPTLTSVDFVGGKPFRFAADRRQTVAFLIGENEYRTWETLPAFARTELEWRGYQTAFVTASTRTDDFEWQNPEGLAGADALVVSVRRRALPQPLRDLLEAHLKAGRGLVGLRTASHAFAVRGPARARLDQDPELVEWPGFDPEVFGGNYRGHHGAGPKTVLTVASHAVDHPVLTGVLPESFPGHGSLYRTGPLHPGTTLLLDGRIPGQPVEPVAWVNAYGPRQAPVFYTSLGHPDDFEEPGFRRLLLNAILWTLNEPVPPPSPAR